MHVVPGSRKERRQATGKRPGRQHVSCVALCLLLVTFLTASCTFLRVTRPVVKIGLVGPFEGPYRYVGYDAIYAARLALREANAAGGVGGYTVQLVAYDDQGTVAGARTAARNLALDADMVAVIGHFRDETTVATRALYAQADLSLVVAGTVEGGIGTESELLCPLLDFLEYTAQSRGESDRVVQWMTGDPDGKELVCADGLTIKASAKLPPSSDVDMVLLTLDPVTAGETWLALRQAGWEGVIAGGPTLGSPLFAQIADPVDVTFVTPYRWPDVEGMDADFSAAYQSLGPHVPRPGPFALTTYQAVQALLAAIETAVYSGETPTRQALSRHLAQSPAATVYLYRWGEAGKLELLKTIARDD
jgi:ABC-type branched-subunit amino acid transport system substrate-binding protein